MVDSDMDYPLFRNARAVRVGNAVQVFMYTDTDPYTTPQMGSPLGGGFFKLGDPTLVMGQTKVGARLSDASFPLVLFCFEGGAV